MRKMTPIASGLVVLLSIASFSVEATAEVFFIQGEPGPHGPDGLSTLECDEDTCTFGRSLVIEGALEVDEPALCPQGYARDTSEPGFVLCRRGLDQMVRVGSFWVDRFEASVWEMPDCSGEQFGDDDDWADVSETFPVNGGFTAPLYACSIAVSTPARYLTWFQAQAACTAAGKHLITNAEWQAAAAATEDPGASDGEDGSCLTRGGREPRATGGGSDCVSYWGAEDMIGNLWEWTADWWGLGDTEDDGSQPGGYFEDIYRNVDPAQDRGDLATHFPAVARRGGGYGSATGAGRYSISLESSPSDSGGTFGFRCALGY